MEMRALWKCAQIDRNQLIIADRWIKSEKGKWRLNLNDHMDTKSILIKLGRARRENISPWVTTLGLSFNEVRVS